MKKIPKISKWANWLFPIAIALFFQAIAILVSMFEEPVGFAWYSLAWSIAIVFIMWGIGWRIGKRFHYTNPDQAGFWKRILQQYFLVTVVQLIAFNCSFVIVNFIENNYLDSDNPLSIYHLLASTVLGFILSLMINVIQMGYQVLTNWQYAQLEANQFKHESTLANLENLKQQIDPHFMFNNFSTLHGLIYEDQDKAGDFLLQLSDVYRKVLACISKESHSLEEELSLIYPYTELLSIRYGQHLHFEINIPKEQLTKEIVTMGLQIPVENAIKHNRIDQEHPLKVSIRFTEDNQLLVENNLQARSSLPHSTGIGLENLNTRCLYLCSRSIEITPSSEMYRIYIPIWENNLKPAIK